MTRDDADLSRLRRAVQLRDRCRKAAMADGQRLDIPLTGVQANVAFDAIADLIRADERDGGASVAAVRAERDAALTRADGYRRAAHEAAGQLDGFRKRLALATRFDISLLPEDDINAGVWGVSVERTAPGRWAVRRMSKRCLSTAGEWDWEPIPSEREDEWLDAHRFDLETALQLAQDVAPTVRVNGITAAELAAQKASQG